MDLGDADLYLSAERYQRWREHTEADAVLWSGPGTSPGGFWSVFSHEHCRSLFAHSAPFTSEYGMMIGFDADHPDRSGGRMLVVSDGARHARLRKLIGPFLSRMRAVSMEDAVRREIRTHVEALCDGEVHDVATGLAPRIPAAVVCEVLDIPVGERDRLIELTNHAFGGADETFDKMTPSQAHTEILYYFNDLIARRRRRPGQDLISGMLRDQGLSASDVVINCDNVLIGGNETTRHAIAGCFEILGERPELLTLLRERPEAVHPLIEEVLRWTSPAMHVLRVATEQVTIGGQEIAKGSAVVAWLAAANRDERVFPEADVFRPDRQPNKHLGFGYGPHVCLGAALARLEIRLLLEALAELTDAVVVPTPPVALRSNLVQGRRSLRVTVTPRGRVG
ncbi:cytochrome P450 [Micromonospora siamensis]|uniref:Hydroxylation protein CepL n=1 Tax=Micromonospora siamensis TaxID=299152 RepID=A0A1C5HEE8_9ACTN|nr:cytochrome P450 [Micromonospora siamensis]SCG44398.1 hydroxylation protein CepL [Micromonospora siamensis]